MKRISVLTGFAALIAFSGGTICVAQTAPGAAATQPDAERLVIANEVVELIFPPEGRQAMFARALDAMTAQARAAVADRAGLSADPGVERIIDRFFARVRTRSTSMIAEHSAPLFTAMARAYARRFTRDELIAVRGFAATPAGGKFLRQSAEILSDPDVARANTDYMRRVVAEMQPMEAELRRELMDYVRDRAERPIAPSTGTH